ncbi:DUF1289 domain-containing protein [Azospirillum brasilense]|uniref:DUF1289 domain-containing protein n=1 Tax=Azospirillum brasilense TaxID=192 RepID=A0A4D8R1N3_AZOBR|nr:DUF1289 domain-containing protein [Azospirillum brasilense]QCO14643.1 DUF1289 domain-containing protein [Azospirillum brasilense]
MDDENPCVGICIIGDDGYCEGCGRSEDEIYGTPPVPAPTPTKTEEDGQAD